MVLPTAAASEAACEQLNALLGRELAVLQSVQDAAGAAAAVPQLEAVYVEMAAMDRSYEAEKALWEYIENTPGVMLPLLEALQRVAIEYTRLEKAKFYEVELLRSLLAPRVMAPEKRAEH